MIEMTEKRMDPHKLDKILHQHSLWLSEKGRKGKRAYLAHSDLSGLDLSGVDLRYAHLHSANLDDTNLSKAFLDKADLTFANLHNADLGHASMMGAALNYADLRDADLRFANLNHANLYHAQLEDALLNGADLSEAKTDDRILCLDRIGNDKLRTIYNVNKNIVWCGWFKGTFEEWVEQIRNSYPDKNSIGRKEYEAAIAYFKAIAKTYK